MVLTEWEKEDIVGEVISLATRAMFNHHFYTFGGKVFHQKSGGPIGLRGTCSIARLIMQLYDKKWAERMEDLGVVIWLLCRYMDDTRILMPEIKAGWRWDSGRIRYCKRWEREDLEKSGTERTREVILQSLKGIEEYLDFTIETGEDPEFVDGWLPTLDTSLKVDDRNQVVWRFYEKPTTTIMTVQKDSAMEENSKMKILSNDLVRRFLNSSEDLGGDEKCRIVDGYAKKLLSSGYSREKTKEIILRGIKGYEGKLQRCKRENIPLRRTAKESNFERTKKKLTAKSSWFRVKRKRDDEYTVENSKKKRDARRMENKGTIVFPHKSVLFVEQTKGGELASNLRNLLTRLAPTLGFGIKVVERAGASLRSKFSQGALWDGAKCGRGDDCITCSQSTETLPPCTRVSVVYENHCTICNQEAGGTQEARTVENAPPSIYIGETSRSIQERALEHHADLRNKREKSHMYKHRVLHHEDKETPFLMKVISFHKSALSRQAAEAVRIRRRGGEGSILNSKAEFNRSYIPRLTLVEEEKLVEMDRLEEEAEKLAQEEIRNQQEAWESGKVEKRAADIRRDLEKTSKHGKRRKDLKEGCDLSDLTHSETGQNVIGERII